jgi:hypothetical protein
MDGTDYLHEEDKKLIHFSRNTQREETNFWNLGIDEEKYWLRCTVQKSGVWTVNMAMKRRI